LNNAQKNGYLKVETINIRDFTEDKHKQVDDYPYGGGAGMVMKVKPIVSAIQWIKNKDKEAWTILLTPQGERLCQDTLDTLINYHKSFILICGRYEGIDERIKYFVDQEISIGDYILCGGEIAALVLIEALTRLVPGVLGGEESVKNESFLNYLLEYPQYTRPSEFKGMKVPEILLSGNHKEIYWWRRKQSLKRTMQKRPDLIRKANLSDDDVNFLEEIKLDISKKNI
jgi:tRNA (guanine37-N1)-methyltransferase